MHAGHEQPVVAGILQYPLTRSPRGRLVRIERGADVGIGQLQRSPMHQVAYHQQPAQLVDRVPRRMPYGIDGQYPAGQDIPKLEQAQLLFIGAEGLYDLGFLVVRRRPTSHRYGRHANG